jgi:hypothetical protein
VIDYRKLLLKYILHVGEEEGITFLGEHRIDGAPYFSDAEREELKKLDDESATQADHWHAGSAEIKTPKGPRNFVGGPRSAEEMGE